MDSKCSWLSGTFELGDIEIIDHKNENEEKVEKWYCDNCSLFFLEKEKLEEHKKTHSTEEVVRCKYCNKTIYYSEGNKECYLNKKCETCEYKCSKCPQRFLRRSSLINHEKKHSSPKKKRVVANKNKNNGVCSESNGISKGVKRKRTEPVDSEELCNEAKTKKVINTNTKKSPKNTINFQVKGQIPFDSIENSPKKTPKGSSLKASKVLEERSVCETSPAKITKRTTPKANKLSEENNSGTKQKSNTTTVSPQGVSQGATTSISENVVNYKPFSCHVCGDTFASDSALLHHIKTHGENAANSFKCKYCGDEFDDIYKMQYHLAICPLAEDELETSLKQVIPATIPAKYSGGSSGSRKRGRPKKSVESPLEQESIENDSTPSSNKRRNSRKRTSEVLESNEVVQSVTGSPAPKQPKKLQNNEPINGSNTNIVEEEENVSDPLSSDINDDRKKDHPCPFPRCDFKFNREKALLCHMRNHSDDFEDSLKCHKCDIPFDDIHTLRQHINTCKGIKEERDDDFDQADCYDPSPNRTFQKAKRDFVCNQCGRSYQNQERLTRCTHEDQHGEDSLACRVCGKEAENEKKLKKHFKFSHPKSLPYQCPTCKAEFDSISAKLEHRRTHVMEEEQFTCIICSFKFPTYKDLYFHYSKDHVEQAQSICKICNIIFPNHLSLEEHNYVRHKGNDRFKCIFCSKTYSSSVSLTVHMKSHSTKVFKCKICYRPFTEMAKLFQHMLFHASTLETEKPLKCAVCLAAYAKKSALKYHISGHTRKNSLFNCLICGEMMSDQESMADHIFDHSIRITENNMTEHETEWVDKIRDKKPVLGRPRLSSKYDPDFKANTKVEKDDHGFKPTIKLDNEVTVSKETPSEKRGRGRPRKIKIECDITPEIKKPARPKKQLENKFSTQLTKPFVRTSEGSIKEENQNNQNPRRSGRLGKEYNLGNSEENGETSNENDLLNDGCTLLSIKKKQNLKSNGEDSSDSNHDILQKSHDVPNKSVLKSQSSNKITRTSHNNNPLPLENTGMDDTTKTKVRPMSFKIFSSLTSTRAPNVVKNGPKNIPVAKEDKSANMSSSVLPDYADIKEEIFDDEEDPLGGIEIPYITVKSKKGLRRSHRFSNEIDDSDCSLDFKKKANKSNHDEEDEPNDFESRNSNSFIKEKRYFEPSRGLTKYSCTTCLLPFSSQEELLFHNTTHIL